MTAARPERAPREWDFGYAPLLGRPYDDDGAACDLVVATRRAVEARSVASALAVLFGDDAPDAPDAQRVRVTELIAEAPLFWVRVQAEVPAGRAEVARLLENAGMAVRYVTWARAGSMALAPPLEIALRRGSELALRGAWRVRSPSLAAEDNSAPERWFLRDEGVAMDRAVCGTGAGMRLAVIDDDAADVEHLDLDALIPVGMCRVPAAHGHGHGARVAAWAVGARRIDGTPPFRGVAPDASPRLYGIPKPGEDVVSLPLAIARAVLDGADVVVCATYVEGATSPMLDDAMEVASRLGRCGRGTPVVLPTGRETSSAPGSFHASLSLALGDPASDPRASCVAPSGPDGGWFIWRDRAGRGRPFANRGPSVRWLAPGDDVEYPFSRKPRTFHAESSGAAAMAAGVMLLVLGASPELRLAELNEILRRTAAPPAAIAPAVLDALADRADVLPRGRDADGHDSKHGYGRVHATRACLAASDPFASALVDIGEPEAARRVRDLGCAHATMSPAFARVAVRAMLADPLLDHAVRVIARHARLVAGEPARAAAHPPGALARQLALAARSLAGSAVVRDVGVADEAAAHANQLAHAAAGLDGGALERALGVAFARIFGRGDAGPRAMDDARPAVALG